MLVIAEQYDYISVEKKWQEEWAAAGIGEAEPDLKKDKFFLIFAYPNPTGYLHTGHMRGFSYADIIARYNRMKGYNVLFPFGVHATGNGAMGVSIKIKRDPDWIEYLKKGGASSDDIKRMADDPIYVVEYFKKNFTQQFKAFGFLMDWRRTLTTIDDGYKRFIQWQFMKLNEKKLLVQKPYYTTFCVRCGPVAVDPAEMEISKGGNAEKLEFTLLKFKFGDAYLIAATLRPETVYGQTNLWVDPDETYVKAKVDSEIWIVSRQCAEKLKYQKDKVEIIAEVKGNELVGKKCVAPMIHREIPILPSHFCDPNIGTGIVTSVPSDAPYDYIALEDLKRNKEEQKRYNLKPEDVNLEVIKIISSPRFGDFAAKKACEEFNIKSQFDKEKLEEATQEVYKDGFHSGRLNENCGKYAGMPVSVAKDKVKEELIEMGEADIMYDLSEEVICRCGAPVIIKRVDDQWFIRYSDAELTERSKEHVENMNIYPEDYKKNLPAVLDWFQDRACTRMGNLLGTPFPFDERWIIEPIADSTLYPMYYTISKYVNQGLVKAEEMDEGWFDYVFLGRGRPRNEIHKRIREEYEYWYPLDINVGGKEHQTVHFPVFVMNHVAILKEQHWPRGIFVNWWVTGKGGKLSKSKGGVEAIPDAAERYSVDAMRLYYSHVASPFVDMAWDPEAIIPYRNQIKRFYSLVKNFIERAKDSEKRKDIDRWLLSRLNRRLLEANEAMSVYDLKRAVDNLFFALISDVNWYMRRGGKNKDVAMSFTESWLKALTPFIPHVCEELWQELGNKSFISMEKWPEANKELVDEEAELLEDILQSLIDDISNIEKLTNRKASKVHIFVAPDWKREAYKKASAVKNPKQLISELMKDEEIKKHGKEAVQFANWLARHANNLSTMVLSQDREIQFLQEAKEYLSSLFNAEFFIRPAEGSGNQKAKSAVPMKPAVYIE